MIKLFFNPYVQGYEVYVNGVKVEGVANVRIDAANDFSGPKATITAMVEIVNEKPIGKPTGIVKENSTTTSMRS